MFGMDMPDVPEITAEKAWEALQKKRIILLDVRTPHEYSRGNIKGSVNIPLDSVREEVETRIPNKKETIGVYCLSGSRSVVAVNMMMKMGYKAVFNVTSGLLAWRAKSLPLSQPEG